MGNKKTIGILGGLGPESTGYFYLELIKRFSERFKPDSNTEYPHIVIESIPATELIWGVDDKVLQEYIQGLKSLEKVGAAIIAIVCNTAYLYLDIFRKSVSVPIIDLRNEVEKYLTSQRVNSVLVLASKSTIQGKLFNFDNIENIELTDEELNKLSQAIGNFNLGAKKDRQIKIVNSIFNKYVGKADLVICACSEVALMLKGKKGCIDTMDLLIEAILAEYEK